MIPFMTEDIYQNLVRSVDDSAPISVHLCEFPTADESMIDTELEDAMAKVLDIVVLGRSCRNASNIKNRQPIVQMFVKADYDLSQLYKDIILDELNVKKVTFTEDVSDFTSYEFKPQLKTVGPKYGKVLGKIQAALKELDGNKAMDELQENGALKFNFDGVDVELTEEDLLISTAQVEGYVSESDNGITVVLDTNLTDELIEEGFVREIISKIQTMRKDNDYDVMDKITFSLKGNDKIKEIVQKNEDMIKNETLTDEVIYDEVVGDAKEWSINGEDVTFGTKR